LKRIDFYWAYLICLVVLLPCPLRAAETLSNLNDEYKAALARKELDRAAAYICEAAKADPDKYAHKCFKAQRSATDELARYDKFMIVGKDKFGRKDYAGAVNELKEIYFGPHREQAQQMIQEAENQLNHSSQPVATGMQILKQVQAAYESGDFITASTLIPSITDPNLLPITKQLAINIRIYNQSMQEGDAYLQQQQFAAAKQKYEFAVTIKKNGPGNPTEKLRRISSVLASVETEGQVAEAGKSKVTPLFDPNAQTVKLKDKQVVKSTSNNPAKIKDYLVKAQNEEAKGNSITAASDYEKVLAIDPKQQIAVAGKQRLIGAMQKDPPEIEDLLVKGLHSYTQSQFEEARAAISLYLKEDGMQKGGAYFYLGAAFMADAILSDPKEYDYLRRNAVLYFHLAKQEHFKPVEKYIPPKILSVWNQTGI
jgi:hypothetical protein